MATMDAEAKRLLAGESAKTIADELGISTTAVVRRLDKWLDRQPWFSRAAYVELLRYPGAGVLSCARKIYKWHTSRAVVPKGDQLVQVDPASLSVTHIFQGEEVVCGDEDGQAWVATFAAVTTAEQFIDWARQSRRVVMGVRRDVDSSADQGAQLYCGNDGGHGEPTA